MVFRHRIYPAARCRNTIPERVAGDESAANSAPHDKRAARCLAARRSHADATANALLTVLPSQWADAR